MSELRQREIDNPATQKAAKPDLALEFTRRSFLANAAVAGLVLSAGPIVMIDDAQAQSSADMMNRFLAPPQAARAWVYWFWINGNLSLEGVTADLEAMKRIGVEGAVIYHVLGTPAGPVGFLTAQWRKILQHAISEASRLDMVIGINNCDGWGAGGPWVKPEHAMQKVVWTQKHVQGGKTYSDALAQPIVNLGYYRDIAVIALRAPAGDEVPQDLTPHITVKPELPFTVTHEYADRVTARGATVTLMINQDNPSVPAVWDLQVSDDGENFRYVYRFDRGWRFTEWSLQRVFPVSVNFPAVSARFFRLIAPFVHTLESKRSIEGTTIRENARVDFRLLPSTRVGLWEQKAGFENSASHHGPVAMSVDDGEWVTLEETEYRSLAEADVIDRKDVLDLSKYMESNGRLTWKAPPGNWVVLRIGHTPTGHMSGAATTTGKGLDVDKFNPAGLDAHFASMAGLLLHENRTHVGRTFSYVFNTSWESEAQNWSVNFADEFARRRGYSLTPFLPVMAGGRVVDSLEVSERFLWDLRRTFADLIAENYWGRFTELAHANGARMLGKAIGPAQFMADPILYQSKLDLISGEFWLGQELKADCKLTASVAHIYDHKYACAEAFTSMEAGGYPKAGGWIDHPYLLKGLGDRALCSGINRFVFHRYVHQPQLNANPGMSWVWGSVGAIGTNFDRSQTWWESASVWLRYVARCQHLLQEGRFVADLAVMMNEGPPSVLKRPEGLPAGYDYDGINSDVLSMFNVEDGELVLPSGMRYRMLVLPPLRKMTPNVALRVAELARAGATVVGAKPTGSPSLADYPDGDAEVRRIAEAAWGGGPGKVWEMPVADALKALKLGPDFTAEGAKDVDIRYIHRRIKEAEVYFISNQQKRTEALLCSFRVEGLTPELWDPDSGRMITSGLFEIKHGRTYLPLLLDPYGSLFVVFRQAALDPAVEVSRDGQVWPSDAGGLGPAFQGFEVIANDDGTLLLVTRRAGVYRVRTASGSSFEARVPELAEISVDGPWEVRFPANCGAPAEVYLPTLISWSEFGHDGVRHFSGTATYIKRINVPRAALAIGQRIVLDLGQVHELAEVSIGGKNVGVAWRPPYRLDVTDALKPGANDLEIKLTNLWANRLIGDEKLPENQRFTQTNWRPFTKDDALLPSGLLGPVRLCVVSHVPMM